ncbi:uncharacterized protein PADG_02369 [Paracoccidioides brasiliensis Pb18]|uniref:Uncharacterized protein n=1 Tax=Paracoccidioides brasiliensis (strain Pb18) TaxID=502780 RepID=C1G2K3_PARBD|nr:uncharacterized protein PADG_02369 [Paracoccidioides brasiliensis Pb18]EEH46219.1 hypothetical protein PADG_02369 [Paracoccidioides brasiliensis Pb18]
MFRMPSRRTARTHSNLRARKVPAWSSLPTPGARSSLAYGVHYDRLVVLPPAARSPPISPLTSSPPLSSHSVVRPMTCLSPNPVKGHAGHSHLRSPHPGCASQPCPQVTIRWPAWALARRSPRITLGGGMAWIVSEMAGAAPGRWGWKKVAAAKDTNCKNCPNCETQADYMVLSRCFGSVDSFSVMGGLKTLGSVFHVTLPIIKRWLLRATTFGQRPSEELAVLFNGVNTQQQPSQVAPR